MVVFLKVSYLIKEGGYMKTAVILGVIVLTVLYSLRSLIKHFKGEDSCCGCAGKSNGTCNCAHKHLKK